MCELTNGMAGERHGRGMLCVNRPLGCRGMEEEEEEEEEVVDDEE